MLFTITAILGGVIAASSVIVAQKPNAQELIDKLTPYQGWIGVVLAFFGAWGIISAVMNIGSMGIYWIIGLVMSLATFVVGFLLGYGLISKYLLEKNEMAKEKGQQLRLKLVKYQVPAGVLLIVVGILNLLGSLGVF